MPPPQLPHEGRLGGSGKEIRLLVAGDSSVAAVGMDRLDETLAYNIARCANRRSGQPVRWRAAGANSATSGDIRDHVIPHVGDRDFTHVVLVVGTNDMKNFHAVRRFKREFGTLLYALRTRFPEARIVWSPVADMTRIPALPRALGRILQMRAELINSMGARLCRERGAVVADPPPIEGPEGFARDGFHAGALGYRRWAEHLTDHILAGPSRLRLSELERADEKYHQQPGERQFPEIAAFAQSGHS